MRRTCVPTLLSLLALLLIATGAAAAAPRAVPYPGIAAADETARAVGATQQLSTFGVAASVYADPVAAALAIGTRLVDLQSDVTEDNAGNGDPDSPLDGNDGGWDWVVTGQAHHANDGSYENLYGPIARGLVEAAIFTGDARLGVGAGDVFAGISQAGLGLLGREYYRIFDGDIATAYLRWGDHTANGALKDTIKARHDQELSVRGGAGGYARYVRNGRTGQGLAGLWPWDIHLLANDCDALAGGYPGSAGAYLAEVDSISQVIIDDMNGLLGPNGWSPTTFTQNYHQTGLAGALRVWDASPRSDDDLLATAMRDSLVNGQLPDGSWGVSYGGVFYGQDIQTTAYAVLALMEYSARHADATARHAAIAGQQWLMTMVGAGGVVDDGYGEYAESAAELLQALLVGDDIAPVAPAACITPGSCLQVPVVFSRIDNTPMRAFSVKLTLGGGLSLCGAGIVEGDYLNGVAGTNFQVLSLGGGVYTVDCAILGATCGATGSGTLFTLNVTSGAPGGTGTVTINSVIARDCTNGPIGAVPGAPASITIDNVAPVAIGDLAAAQVKAGNDGDGTTDIALTFTAPPDAAVVEVYRAGYGSYPEYDDAGGSVPATPGAYPPGAPWALTGVTATGQTDEVTTRDFWYYVAYVQDACGNWSAVSNQTGGTLNYHLGDVADGVTDCAGNNLVSTADLSLLGAHYGATLSDPDAYACLDVGPTTDYYVNARPITDNKVDFEDLMMFAINYGQVAAPGVIGELAYGGSDGLWVEGPSEVSAGESFTVSLRMSGAGDLQGVSAQLGWDGSVAEPVAVTAGEWLSGQNGVVYSAGPGNVDAAVLGAGRGIVGEGVLATATFQALRAGDPKVVLGAVDARDRENRRVALAGVTPQAPSETTFGPAQPNPFAGVTTLSYTLARGGEVALGIYTVDGRRVRTLASGAREPGVYRVSWDGRDEAGRQIGSGVYFAKLVTPDGRFHRTVVLTK